MANTSALLNVMITAARDAGKSLRRDYFEVDALQVSRKGAADFVSVADTNAEKAVYESLSKARPKYGFVMEEGGEIEGSDNSNRWFIDPLDGTTNFLHGIPQFAVSIGLERDREPYAGVVYNPITDELFYAEKGFGCFVNDRRLRVSGRNDLTECLFAHGLPYKGKAGADIALRETNNVLAETAGMRRFGAASLDLAMVAMGRFDAYWERMLSPWDICAGAVLVREAGGTVSELDAEGGRPHLKGEILATNGHIHDAARALIRRG
jgi:myo-inositol-1(or 4)-monophosphatase